MKPVIFAVDLRQLINETVDDTLLEVLSYDFGVVTSKSGQSLEIYFE